MINNFKELKKDVQELTKISIKHNTTIDKMFDDFIVIKKEFTFKKGKNTIEIIIDKEENLTSATLKNNDNETINYYER